ncbi:hypothetical protein BGW36DRAFT_429471 [Talaromyces proteolyticus]|uniref:NodB homology domain-containing protein n=1 Tax=Talaromyces proteolyticus TaxID=1131652 RepID=A0AAD4KLY1_9EURO|nr:uncharacterized protein BGW36DRAFT_429471 [Talaromyces proteolyticus]KAH8695599.1 hypothetical protein BGW36DRAFT_429471 [Talaromyces proteolyticus]
MAGFTTLRPRDFTGYGDLPPRFTWPGGKKVATNLAINYEEGTERNPLLGDSERDLMQEGEYEYGTRAIIWPLLRHFKEFDAPYSVFLSSDALTVNVNPALSEMPKTEDCDIVSHGTRSISRVGLTEEMERADLCWSINQAGKRILGAFPRSPITENNRRIMADAGPYTGSTDCFDYLKDAFDILYPESNESATMISIGLHAQIMRPGGVASIIRFLEYVNKDSLDL